LKWFDLRSFKVTIGINLLLLTVTT
jgi:hypothetical protein